MKIALPVLDNDCADPNISPSFGRAQYFLIYDLETEEKTFIENAVATASQGGAGILAAQLIVDQKVAAVLTPRCGTNAADVLHAAGIKLYKTVFAGVQESIDAYKAQKLTELDDIHPGFHRHGGE